MCCEMNVATSASVSQSDLNGKMFAQSAITSPKPASLPPRSITRASIRPRGVDPLRVAGRPAVEDGVELADLRRVHGRAELVRPHAPPAEVVDAVVAAQ